MNGYSITPEASGAVTLGAVELTSIALGYLAADAMLKVAPVTLLEARAVCPGKFFIVVTGDVASVEEAVYTGAERCGGSLAGKIIIPNIARQVIPAVNRKVSPSCEEAAGIFETFSAVSTILAADAAVKAAEIELESVNLVNGLGGKAFFVATGRVSDMEAAIDAAKAAIEPYDLADAVIIPRMHEDLTAFFPGR